MVRLARRDGVTSVRGCEIGCGIVGCCMVGIKGAAGCVKRLCSNFQPARTTKLAAPTNTGSAARPMTAGKFERGAGSDDWLS